MSYFISFIRRVFNNLQIVFVLLDGGRLQTELAYNERHLGEGYGSTSEIILQTGDHVLTPDSLLLHYEAVRAATKVEVNVDNTYVQQFHHTALATVAAALAALKIDFHNITICIVMKHCLFELNDL